MRSLAPVVQDIHPFDLAFVVLADNSLTAHEGCGMSDLTQYVRHIAVNEVKVRALFGNLPISLIDSLASGICRAIYLRPK